MQPFLRYHEYKLQTLFQNEQYFVATYQEQLSPLPTVVFLSCPLVKKHADLLGTFVHSHSTMKDMYSKPTNRT